MAWTVKAGVPEYVSWLESARVAILGTDYEWVGEYFWLLSERTLATAPFCELGPVDCAPLNPLDFLGLVGAGRFGAGVQAATLGEKLQCFLQQKMFEAYCENVVETGGSATWHLIEDGCWTLSVGLQDGVIWSGASIPNTSTGLRVNYQSGPPGFDLHTCVHAGAQHTEQTGVDTPSPGETGKLTGPGTSLPGTATQDFAAWRGSNPNVVLWPSVYVGGSHGAEATPFCGTVEWYGVGAGVEPFEAPPLERPPYALTPPSGTYDDISDLGKELDNIERKLHVIIEQGITTEIDRAWPLAVESDVLPVVSDDDVELIDVAGVIVTLSNIGNQVDEHFGEPRQLHRVGRIVFGTSAGWLAPIEITVTPQLFVGLPPGVTKVRLHLLPPTTGSMQMVKRVTPTG